MADRMCGDQDLGPFVDGREEFLSLAEGILRNQAEAEDVVQDSWLRWKNRSADCVSPRAFLRAIVRNLALDRIRRRRSERVLLCTPQLEPLRAPDAEETTIQRQRLATAERALAELPERTREAFRMRRIEGRSLREIADVLGVSQPRAHQLVCQAVARIAGALQD